MKTPSTEAGSLTDAQIDKIADEHLSYQEESRSASGIYEFANACVRAALSAASPLPAQPCDHWPGQKECHWCDLGHQAEASSRGAVQRQDGDTERRAEFVDALGVYWGCAYREGQENREIDTEGGAAQEALFRLMSLWDAAMKERP